MIIAGTTNINGIFDGIINAMVWDPETGVDLTRSPTIYSYDNMLLASSCDFDFDLKTIGMTKSWWTRFLNQYFTSQQIIRAWLDSIDEQTKGVVNFLATSGKTNVMPDHYHPERKGHHWGACLLGVSFRLAPRPTLTLYSRTAQMPTTATMELIMVSLLAKEIQKRYHIDGRIRFTWLCSAINITAFDIMPYLVSQGLMEKFLATGYPFTKFVARQYQKASESDITREAAPYIRQRRAAKRVWKIAAGTFPSCPITSLSLWDGAP